MELTLNDAQRIVLQWVADGALTSTTRPAKPPEPALSRFTAVALFISTSGVATGASPSPRLDLLYREQTPSSRRADGSTRPWSRQARPAEDTRPAGNLDTRALPQPHRDLDQHHDRRDTDHQPLIEPGTHSRECRSSLCAGCFTGRWCTSEGSIARQPSRGATFSHGYPADTTVASRLVSLSRVRRR